jgi:hypothetical protein
MARQSRHGGGQITAYAPHPSGRQATPRRAFGNPVAAAVPNPAYEAPPFTNKVNLLLPIHVIMPDQWIADAGKIVFHSVGDTGGVSDGAVQQTSIAHVMQAQVDAAAATEKPAFFYNLGDVVYFNGQSSDYSWQFYEPYQFYQPHIFAIAGNHDGDIRTRRNDPPVTEPSLTGFMDNFCDDRPREIQPYHRDTMTQPYVYWALDAPFVRIVGLYSNVDGTLDASGGFEQRRWLREQLTAAADLDKCLVVAVHHPPYSLDAAHGGSPDILAALDRAVADTHKSPDVVLSGHVHNYQRFTRRAHRRDLPFVVAGAGGYAHFPKAMHQLQKDGNRNLIRTPFDTTEPGVTLESYNETDTGFLRITVDDKTFKGEYFLVPFQGEPPADPFDTFTLDWKRHTLT